MITQDFLKQAIKKYLPESTLYSLRQNFYTIRSTFYQGTKFNCPICKKTAKKFINGGRNFQCLEKHNVVGGGHFINNYCPKCNSGYKERLLYLYLESINFFDPNAMHDISVLHIAPEWSLRDSIKKNIFKKYITGDLNSSLVDEKIDITSINYPDDTFDIVICNHVLEHVIEDKKAMHEIHRITRTGGRCILQVPYSESLEKTLEDENAYNLSNQEREELYGQWDHIRIYSKKNYLERLKEVGFSIEEYKFNEENNFSLNPQEKLITAKKHSIKITT